MIPFAHRGRRERKSGGQPIQQPRSEAPYAVRPRLADVFWPREVTWIVQETTGLPPKNPKGTSRRVWPLRMVLNPQLRLAPVGQHWEPGSGCKSMGEKWTATKSQPKKHEAHPISCPEMGRNTREGVDTLPPRKGVFCAGKGLPGPPSPVARASPPRPGFGDTGASFVWNSSQQVTWNPSTWPRSRWVPVKGKWSESPNVRLQVNWWEGTRFVCGFLEGNQKEHRCAIFGGGTWFWETPG